MNPIASLIQGIEVSLRAGIEQDMQLQQVNQQLMLHQEEIKQLRSKASAVQHETTGAEQQLIALHTAFGQLVAETAQQADVWSGVDARLIHIEMLKGDLSRAAAAGHGMVGLVGGPVRRVVHSLYVSQRHGVAWCESMV